MTGVSMTQHLFMQVDLKCKCVLKRTRNALWYAWGNYGSVELRWVDATAKTLRQHAYVDSCSSYAG